MRGYGGWVPWAVGVLCVGLGACEVDPEDPLFLSGSILLPDGGTAEGVQLILEHSTGPAPHLVPVDERPPGPPSMEALQTLASRADGTWRAEVLSFDGLSAWHNAPLARLMSVRHRAQETFGPVQVSFVLGDDDVALPPLQQWLGSLQVWSEKGAAYSRFNAFPPPAVPRSPLQPADVSPPEPEAPFLVVEGAGGIAWRASPVLAGVTQMLPYGFEYIAEDFEPTARVAVRTRGVWFYDSLLKGPKGGSVDYVLEHSLAPVRVPSSGSRIPFTRGATCPDIVPEGPCPVTDGRLEAVQLPPRGAIELKLLRPQPVEWLVLLFRGVYVPGATRVQLFIRFDGETEWVQSDLSYFTPDWENGFTDTEEFFDSATRLSSAKAVAALRIDFPGSRIRYLREVSAWAACGNVISACP